MKVSVIVPVYNVEKYIDRCLNTLINQTLKDIEIILVDDNSPDNCPKICEDYAKKDKRIKVIHKKKNEGLGLARNSGLEIASGEYIAFIDSDDYVDLDFFEKLYNNSENSDIVYGALKNEIDGKVYKIHKNQLPKNLYENDEIIPEILYNIIGHTNNKNISIGFSSCWSLYRKEIFDKYNIKFYSERKFISEDCIFNLDFISKCKKVKFVGDTYYHYCYNQNSLTKKYNEKRFELVKILNNEIIEKTKKLGIYEDVKKGINYSFIGNVRVCIKQEKYNSKKIAIKNIRKICADEMVQNTLKQNYNKTLKQKIFDFLMKEKLAKIIYLIINK